MGTRRIDLTPGEWRLLRFLHNANGDYCDKPRLTEALWQESEGDAAAALRQMVRSLRRKLHDTGATPRFIETSPVRGHGYRWNGPHITVGATDPARHRAETRPPIAGRQRASRVEFFDRHRSAHLDDWQVDAHWPGFDRLFEMCAAPNLVDGQADADQAGWRAEDVYLRPLGAFPNAPRLEESYRSWRATVDPKKLKKDGAKYVLVNHPTSETDEHVTELELRATKWSRVQACYAQLRRPDTGREALFRAIDPDWRTRRKPTFDLAASELPTSLCLHGLVVTRDHHVLAIQRPGPARTDYHPHAWSFSFEEQLSPDDLQGPRQRVSAAAWLRRAVRQEVLGDEISAHFDPNRARLLAVAIEEEIGNPFVVAYLPLECDAATLARCLPHAPDRAEWNRFRFVPFRPPFSALSTAFIKQALRDNHALHPTSRYRIYLAMAAAFPSHDVGALLARARRAQGESLADHQGTS